MVLTSRRSSVVGLLVAAAVLYLARQVLIPLALAILLAFLLAPVVRGLERWHLRRIPSTLIVVLVSFSLIAGVGLVAVKQALDLAAKLPEYRQNITTKIRAVRESRDGPIGKAAEAIKELGSDTEPAAPPLPVAETPPNALAALAEVVRPFVEPVGTALAVIVFTVLILLNRENMRDRLIGLIGPQRINVTTRALGEASFRVSQYLYMQLVVNACFGIPFGIALYFIGVPNALLWGLLATLLRFVPYAGVWVATAMPAVLAFAIFDGWSETLWVAGTFLALELLLVNLVEPWLYGRSAGLSPIAIIAAALFWTWLWGPVGLLLATPLTVCVAVMGRHIPELGYLNVLLGVEPVLPPEARFYQRLVALDNEEAATLAEEFAGAHGAAALVETLLIPALSLAENDRHQGALEPARARFVLDTTRQIVEEIGAGDRSAPTDTAPGVCIVPAHDEADQLAAEMLARLLPGSRVCSAEDLGRCRVVCISAVPPRAARYAAYLARRLKKTLPKLRIVIALWGSEDVERLKERLVAAGADEVAARLEDVQAHLRA